MTPYPKRIIEVDLPIARISAHARREKSIRHGHISTLHIWWARRPLAACRAVILASLWPDPEDLTAWLRLAEEGGPGASKSGAMGPEVRAPRNETLKPGEGVVIRPRRFLDEARSQMARWAKEALVRRRDDKISEESFQRLAAVEKGAESLDDPTFLRTVLLDFIADFANWDNSTDADFLATSRALVQAAHEALGGEPGTRPMVVDPFAGGGSIPLEALRVGADAFASDLNPIPVLLNKVVLEYIPKYGQRLADEVRNWGQWVKEQAEQQLAEFYPKDPDGSTPIAYLWARTILSEAPGQGDIPVEVPLMRSLWLAKKAGRRRALRWVRDDKGKVKTRTLEVAYVEDGQRILKRVKRPLLEIFEPAKESEVEGGTVARGHATCPVTGYTTKVDRVREQLKSRRGGAADARLFCVVTTREDEQGRFYRLPTKADQEAFDAAAAELERREKEDGTQRSQKGRKDGEGIAAGQGSRRSLVPDEAISLNELRRVSVPIYGMERWGDLFSPRQALALTTLAQLVREAGERLRTGLPVPVDALEEAATVASKGSAVPDEPSRGTKKGLRTVVEPSRSVVEPLRRAEEGLRSVNEASTTLRKGSSAPVQPSRRAKQPSFTPSDGTPLAAVAASRAVGSASGRGHGAFSGLSSDSEDDRADNDSGAVDAGLAEAVMTCLALAMSKGTDLCNSLTRWKAGAECPVNLFGRQAVPMVWEFAEAVPTVDSSGSFISMLERTAQGIDSVICEYPTLGHVEQASATNHPLPDDAAAAFVTDPPYYDAVPYAYLSDFFYVWMRRTLADVHPALFREGGVPKDAEIVVDRPHQLSKSTKDIAFYERELTKAFAEGRRVLAPSGVGTIVFASKTTASWEAILKAVIDAGFIITGSWPIDTEMETRVAAQGQARLGSSVHIVVRPRETPSGALDEGEVGDWRTVLEELPRRIREWMPRLEAEGVVGADAIFACLGPALEIYSRYSRVEQDTGAPVGLPDYLEKVWATVSTEALSLIFHDADAGGLEPDARLTAMWLWTLGAGEPANSGNGHADAEDAEEDEDEGGKKAKPTGRGFALEFDAARKIAQGLGVHLEKCQSFVEVKGETARLLSVVERARYLFGKDTVIEGGTPEARPKGKRKKAEPSLFQNMEEVKAEIEAAEAQAAGKLAAAKPGATVLDRVHQAMLLFSTQRGEALRRFLVDDGVGDDPRFWKLADSLNKLYPGGSEERRAVEGVLARKKSFGF